jgi:dihydroxy-acid dehydratase
MELKKRDTEEKLKGDKAYKPETRDRKISSALRAYASMVSSADLGAIRLI